MSDSVPTFIDEPSDQSGSRLSEHPSGVRVYIRCGGALAWDCIDDQGTLKMEGTQSAKFAANYGFFLKQHTYAHHSVVVCTTCHNPHDIPRGAAQDRRTTNSVGRRSVPCSR